MSDSYFWKDGSNYKIYLPISFLVSDNILLMVIFLFILIVTKLSFELIVYVSFTLILFALSTKICFSVLSIII